MPSRARGRGGVPSLSLQRSPAGQLLAGRRRREHTGPLHVRAAEGRRIRQGRGRQMDRFGDGQLWRSARRHSWELRPCRLPRGHGRGSALSQPATTETRTGMAPSALIGADWVAGIGAATVRHVAVDLPALSRKPICAIAALRLCTEPRTCASTRAAITGPTMTRRPRLGRP